LNDLHFGVISIEHEHLMLHNNNTPAYSNPERLYPWFAAALVLVGSSLRIHTWLAEHSLWVDEAMVALNILDRGYLELATPLAYKQMAPIGYLWLEKATTQLFGTSEMVFHFPSLIASIGLLVVVAWIGLRVLGPLAALIALTFIAINPQLIYYANELKPYGMDAAIAAVWFAATAPWDSAKWSSRRRIGVGILGIAAVLLSFTSVFVIAGTGLARAGGQLLRKERSDCIADLTALVPAAGIFLLQFFLVSGNAQSQYIDPYWSRGFLPVPPTSPAEVKELLRQYFALFEDHLGLRFTGLGGVLFAIGALALLKSQKELAAALLLPLLFLLTASALDLYPMVERLVKFVTPILVLIMAAGVRVLMTRLQTVPMASIALVFMLLIYPLLDSITSLKYPQVREHVRPLLEKLSALRSPGDIVYVYYGAQYAYAYYAPRLDLPMDEPLDTYIHFHGAPSTRGPIEPDAGMTIGISARKQPGLYAADLERMKGRTRTWVVLTHIWPPEEDELIEAELDRMGNRFFEAKSPGAKLWGYDLYQGDPSAESNVPAN
jgi:hypothetical protein